MLTGRTISWSSSASTVATVSTSGLVTSVASGSATITATSDGKQGTAVITVVSHPDGPVVARGDIGALGGTLGSGDVAITIAAGVLSNPSTIELVRDTLRTDPVPEQSATGATSSTGSPPIGSSRCASASRPTRRCRGRLPSPSIAPSWSMRTARR
ncbi:MAG: Ig-like domain-containing protein [Gemmatimonadetes bacterium]|nr:Ig-like domain-containing protein [Gemmatimonadota bacterium]